MGILQQSEVASRVYTLLESEDDDMSFRSKWKLLAQSSAFGMVRHTVKARRTIFYAADEAIQDMSNEVTPKHLLLGLLRADESLRAHLVIPTIDLILLSLRPLAHTNGNRRWYSVALHDV